MPLRPAQVHAHQHLRPVGRICPADAGADREHRVALVVRTGELRLKAGLLDLFREPGKVALQVGGHGGVIGKLGQLGEIGGALAEGVPPVDARADKAEPLHDLLGRLAVVPQVGAPGLGL